MTPVLPNCTPERFARALESAVRGRGIKGAKIEIVGERVRIEAPVTANRNVFSVTIEPVWVQEIVGYTLHERVEDVADALVRHMTEDDI